MSLLRVSLNPGAIPEGRGQGRKRASVCFLLTRLSRDDLARQMPGEVAVFPGQGHQRCVLGGDEDRDVTMRTSQFLAAPRSLRRDSCCGFGELSHGRSTLRVNSHSPRLHTCMGRRSSLQLCSHGSYGLSLSRVLMGAWTGPVHGTWCPRCVFAVLFGVEATYWQPMDALEIFLEMAERGALDILFGRWPRST